jgi:hypothetical protein
MSLHPVGSVGHVVHPGASVLQNVDALFFMLGWARCSFPKKCAGTCYVELVFLHLVGSVSRSAFRCFRGLKCQRTIFHGLVGPVHI